jgi:hypothetical protein
VTTARDHGEHTGHRAKEPPARIATGEPPPADATNDETPPSGSARIIAIRDAKTLIDASKAFERARVDASVAYGHPDLLAVLQDAYAKRLADAANKATDETTLVEIDALKARAEFHRDARKLVDDALKRAYDDLERADEAT